jgi:acyl-coenzyme A synthetase/AMP-(fatty) acid ligase
MVCSALAAVADAYWQTENGTPVAGGMKGIFTRPSARQVNRKILVVFVTVIDGESS